MVDESARQADARRRHELAQAAANAEAQAAQQKLDQFVAELQDAGAAPEPLQATLLNGSRVKTGLVGWYLNRARTLAVAPDGHVLPAGHRGFRRSPGSPGSTCSRASPRW